MGLFRRGSVWWMSFIYQGKQHRKSTETDDKELAKRIWDKVKGQIAEGKWFERPPGEDKTFKEMMEKYMAEQSSKKSSEERDRSSLTHLRPFFGDYLLRDITPSLINEYKAKRNVEAASPCTINRELSLMKHAFNIALKEWEWVNQNPVLRVSMEREPPSRDRWLTFEEEKKLLAISSPWLQEIITFAVETGCRREEMLSLGWRSVDLLKRTAVIFGKKTGDRRTIPLTQRAFEVIEARARVRSNVRSINQDLIFTHPEGQRVNINTLRKVFNAALRRAKIEGFRFHDLRHTFASRLAQSGVDPYAIQRLMGHKTFTTTQRYAHHNSESLKVGIKALEASRAEWGKNSSTNLAQSREVHGIFVAQ
ncbi:MAG: tyrosine-type recombinase/integrase [Thermodesulfobacteriota bacterium]|jgi:integrase